MESLRVFYIFECWRDMGVCSHRRLGCEGEDTIFQMSKVRLREER